jgi:hypothetical protein
MEDVLRADGVGDIDDGGFGRPAGDDAFHDAYVGVSEAEIGQERDGEHFRHYESGLMHERQSEE